jgi:hypothetical protein
MTNDKFWNLIKQPKIDAATIAKDIVKNNLEDGFIIGVEEMAALFESVSIEDVKERVLKNLEILAKEVEKIKIYRDFTYYLSYGITSSGKCFIAIPIP